MSKLYVVPLKIENGEVKIRDYYIPVRRNMLSNFFYALNCTKLIPVYIIRTNGKYLFAISRKNVKKIQLSKKSLREIEKSVLVDYPENFIDDIKRFSIHC